MTFTTLRLTFLFLIAAALGSLGMGGPAGCGNSLFLISGTVSGLSGTMLLDNSGVDDLTVTDDGQFTFNGVLHDGDAYDVTVLTQPAGQTCTVTDGSGTVQGKNILNIEVNCE